MTSVAALPAELAELFDGDLAPTLRRMGERALGGGPVAPEQSDARAAVWETLAETGVLDTVVDGTESPGHLVALGAMMGRSLFRGPYLDTAAAAELVTALGAHAGDTYADLLDAVADGAATVALAPRAAGTDDPYEPAPLVLGEGPGGPWVSGHRRFVGWADSVDWILVVGTVAAGTALALVRADDPGITVRRHDDISRGDLHCVDLHEVPLHGGRLIGDPGPAKHAWRRALATVRVRHAATLVGQAQGALALAVERARSRVQFDQPLARHQSVAFTLAALFARITAVRSFTEDTARDLNEGTDAELAVLQALALAADLVRDAAAQGLHVHGAHGMTEDADIQLYFRRAALDALLWGSPAQLWNRAATLL
ncbi:acyl-CoA dehydrogenase family protein [Streptomyces sp. NPDC096046]|uniref:acyl-CoA dehydrogenase family protein n=1 Tax=Streptomyces sp. NPDC096046 TaxID=3155542 RepID=UPI00332C0F52